MISELSTKSNIFELDDTKLVEKFVQGSNQLLASTNLRLEVNGGVSQLLMRSGDAIAIMYLQTKPQTVIIKHNAHFSKLVDRVLIDRGFVLIGDANRAGFVEYKYYVTPAGYRISYTDPAILWKKWWPTEKFQNKQRFNMDILVNFKDNWYPVQSINVNAGIFTIKTIAGQLVLKRDSKVLWLAQSNQAPIVREFQADVAESVEPVVTKIDAQPYTRSISADLVQKIQEKQLKVDPDRVMLIVHELEEKLKAQAKLNQETEAKFQELESRAMIAEQRLQIAHKFLDQAGFDRQDLYK
ncbi:MAG: hypothetical protein LH474_13370 [Chamaesiphon sp.]|nr:hypothetical protein [Chamaesiphon sp.]